MNKKEKRSELLAPAGTLERLKTAIMYGADAVYVGTPDLSLRTKTTFTLEEIKEGVDYAHARNKKVYLTLNLYAHNNDIKKLPAFLDSINTIKPDGVIIADPGIVNLVKKEFPELEIHISTQANVCSWLTVQYWQDMGASLCVLARELSFKEVKEIKEKCPDMKIETFIHGALCMTYSGRCLLSNFMSERGANQGSCSHSCRWQYSLKGQKTSPETQEEQSIHMQEEQSTHMQDEQSTHMQDEQSTHMQEEQEPTNQGKPKEDVKYFLEEKHRPNEHYEIMEDDHGSYILNSKDLCLMPVLDEYLKAGVDSLKIEGRNKSEYYVAVTTRAYRYAIDSYYDNPTKWDYKPYLTELYSLRNRGYTMGFHYGRVKDVAHNYDKSSSISSWNFAGIITEWIGNDYIVMEVRNTLQSSDVLEFLSPYVFEPIRIRLYEFTIASNDSIVDKVSAGQNQAIKIPTSLFNNVQSIDELKKLLPVDTVARKDVLLNEEQQESLKYVMRSFDYEEGHLNDEEWQQYKDDPDSVRKRLLLKGEALQGKSPRVGNLGCCGLGCNGCLIFWNDDKYKKAREKLEKISHQRLTKEEKNKLVKEDSL